jgi:hypothetical protein
VTEKINKSESSGFFLFVLFAGVAAVVFRIIYSAPIEFNDESILKWQLGSQFLASGDWGLFQGDHHNLRWSVIVSQIPVVAAFPGNWVSYYLTPIACWSFFAVACMGFFRSQPYRMALGIVLLVVIAVEPLGHAMASQVNSGAFGLLYVVCGIYAVLAFVRTAKWVYLLLTALAFFFAYGAHLTFVIFSGAPVLFLFFNRRDFRGTAVFLLMLVALLGLEALILSMVSGGEVQGGRLVEVAKMKTWGDSMMGSTRWKGGETYELHHFFDRWRMLPKYSLMIGVMFVLTTGALILPRLRKEVPNGVWLCFYAAGIYGVAVSAPIIGVQPLQLALDLHSRYLAPFFPLASVFVVWVVGRASQRAFGKQANVFFGVGSTLLLGFFFVGSVNDRCTAEIPSSETLAAKLSVEGLYCRVFRYSQEQVIYPAPDAFILQADHYYRAFANDYVSGKVALYGHTRIGAFRLFVQTQYPHAQFFETPNGWFSIDGRDKPMCVKELGQFAIVENNYHACVGLKMKPGALEGGLKSGESENG